MVADPWLAVVSTSVTDGWGSYFEQVETVGGELADREAVASARSDRRTTGSASTNPGQICSISFDRGKRWSRVVVRHRQDSPWFLSSGMRSNGRYLGCLHGSRRRRVHGRPYGRFRRRPREVHGRTWGDRFAFFRIAR